MNRMFLSYSGFCEIFSLSLGKFLFLSQPKPKCIARVTAKTSVSEWEHARGRGHPTQQRNGKKYEKNRAENEWKCLKQIFMCCCMLPLFRFYLFYTAHLSISTAFIEAHAEISINQTAWFISVANHKFRLFCTWFRLQKTERWKKICHFFNVFFHAPNFHI